MKTLSISLLAFALATSGGIVAAANLSLPEIGMSSPAQKFQIVTGQDTAAMFKNGGDDDDDDDNSGSGHGGDDDGDDDRSSSDDDDDSNGSGRDRPRIPGGSGCDDSGDIFEHAECSAAPGAGPSPDDSPATGSGRDKPRIPGGSGCDDLFDLIEHAECRI